jgi:hypothetical protein
VGRFAGVGIASPDATGSWEGLVPVVAVVGSPEATSKVEFRVDGILQATVRTPVGNAYRWTWNTTGLGDRRSTLNVTQYDAVAARAWSQIVVKVNNLAPAASWVSPAHLSTVKDVVTLNASASDFYGIQRVRFYADGVSLGDGSPKGGGYFTIAWDTTAYCSNVDHTISATATENTAPAKSTTVFAQLFMNNDPLVCITNPAAGGTVNGQAYPVRASTVSSVGITKVEFLVEVPPFPATPQLRFTDTAAPWEWAWDTTRDPNGPVKLWAKAYNMQGKIDAHVIQVTVNNAQCTFGCFGPATGSMAASSAESSKPTATLGVLTSEWSVGETRSGSRTTVVADLSVLPVSLFLSNLQWRLVLRDWSAGVAGNVTAFTLRFEVKSDPNNPDTDEDGIPDGVEVNKWHTLPITRDSDLDGLTDDYEITPHSLTVSVGGTTSIVPGITTDPAKWDTDGDGLSDGQERGFVSFGMTKVVGEVGIVQNIVPSNWTTVYLHNRYTSAVVIAEPSTFRDKAFSHVRISGVTDHTFQVKIEKWVAGGSYAAEDVAYLVVEAGDHVLPDGSVVEAGTATVATGGSTVAFREAFPSAPIVLIQAQTVSSSTPLVAKRTNAFSVAGLGAYLNTNGTTATTSERVGYVAITPQANPSALATWTRAEIYASGQSGNWTYPSNFAATPLIFAWFKGEDTNGNRNIGLRLSSTTNHSAIVYREQSGTAPADTVDFFAFAQPTNLTARMTTRPNGTGSADTDSDGLLDGTEVNTYGSNPTLNDTDSDGIPDKVEVTPRTVSIPVNETLKTITYTTSPTSPDTDADGIPDLQEIQGVLDHRVLYYDMATLNSGTVIRDLSGNGADGNLKSVQTSTTGKVGGSILFNGSANRIQVPSSPWLNLTDGFTIMAWVNPAATTQGATIVAKGYGNSASFAVDMVKSGSKFYFRSYVGNLSRQVVGTVSISTGTWYLVAATYDPIRGVLSLAVNAGTPSTVANVPLISTNAHDMTIGSRESSTTSGYDLSFQGYTDEVQIWDRPLSRAEINATYNLTSGLSYLARFDFETLTSSGRLFDFAGGSHPGVINGTTVVEGRTGLARSLRGGSDGVYLSGSSTLSIPSSVTVDVYVDLAAMPSTDASIVARKGSFYLNISSDGVVRWTAYKVASINSSLPIPLGRWVRITATATGSALNLYLDGVVVASWTGSKTFQGTTSAVTLGYADGPQPQPPQPHLAVALDEFTLLNIAATAWTVADSGPRGIQLNPNATDTDGDGLADGQESYTYTVKAPSRYPIPDGSSATTDSTAISIGVPAWAIGKAVAMVGLTHPDMGQVSDNVYLRSGGKLVQSFALKSSGSNAGQSNNFTSYDLFQLGLSRSTLVALGANAYLIAWDGSSDGKKGQIEYVQLQFTVHTLPNRADMDRDGLNDSEEVTLGRDGYMTNPWKADSDGDGISDSLETNGWSWSGSTIVSDPNGFKTDPTRADTDRDGTPDNRDLAPLGDLFVLIKIDSAYVRGQDKHNGAVGYMPEPFAMATLQGNTTYTPTAVSRSAVFDHSLAVNVPDDIGSATIDFAMWSFDVGGNNNHAPINISRDLSYGGCSGLNTYRFTYNIGQVGHNETKRLYGGCWGGSELYADTFNVTVSTIVSARISSYLVIPKDYSGIYNVTDSSGNVVGRRYVGEPRFVAILVNVTYSGSALPTLYLVPRSVFFDTQMYQRLSTSNTTSPLDTFSFRQNDTSASSNADDVQQILTGTVYYLDQATLEGLLRRNVSGTWPEAHLLLPLSNDLLLYSLPDHVLNLVGYSPPRTSISVRYTFCSGSCTLTPSASWWEQIWRGLVSVVTAFVTSAIVLAVNAFVQLVKILGQLGSWVADQFAQLPGKVASAVQAAAKVLNEIMDWIGTFIKQQLLVIFGPILSLLQSWRLQSGYAVDASWTNYNNKRFVEPSQGTGVSAALFGGFFQILYAIGLALVVVIAVVTVISLGTAEIVGLIATAVLSTMIATVISQPGALPVLGGGASESALALSVEGFLSPYQSQSVSFSWPSWWEWALGLADVVIATLVWIAVALHGEGFGVTEAVLSFVLAAFGIIYTFTRPVVVYEASQKWFDFFAALLASIGIVAGGLAMALSQEVPGVPELAAISAVVNIIVFGAVAYDFFAG